MKGKNSPDFFINTFPRLNNVRISKKRRFLLEAPHEQDLGSWLKSSTAVRSGRCVLQRDAVEEGRERQHVNDLRPRPGCLLFLPFHGRVLHALLLAIRLPAHIPSRPRLIFSSNTPSAFAPASMSCKFSICDPAISNDVGFSTRRSRNVELAKG